jgi:6-phosphogluconolactonase
MTFIRLECFAIPLLLSILLTAAVAKDQPPKPNLLFVGTYTDKDSKGIYAYGFNASSGELTPLGVAAETPNPSFFAIDASHRYLYAVNELQTYHGASTGAVSAFAIDRKTGKLSLLNQVASQGADPCHISFDKSGKYVLVANYTGGTVAVFPIHSDGSLGESSAFLRDRGTLGPNKERQDAPHSHWIEPSADNRFVYVSDLGLDRVLTYTFDATKGTLAKKEAAANLSPGSGPRHVAFSRDNNFLYVVSELDSTVTVFKNDEKKGFPSLQRISALPEGFSGKNDAAEIVAHSNGKFLYTSNRGDDSIAIFSIHPKTGKLSYIDRVPTQGKAPRNFEIDPSGTFLFVANQESNNIVVFRINPKSGKLTPTGQQFQVPAPVCLRFIAGE